MKIKDEDRRYEYAEKEFRGVWKIFKPLWWVLHCLCKKLGALWYDFRTALYAKRYPDGVRRKEKLTKKRRGELIFYCCLIAYPILQFFVFYICVNINSILLAFKQYDIDTATYSFWGFGNFTEFIGDVMEDYAMRRAFTNSFWLYFCGLVIGMPLNLIFSFFMYKKVPLHGFFRVVLFLPQIISTLVISLMFRYFVENGLATLPFPGFNLLLNKKTGFPTMIFYNIWASFGTQILIYTSSMNQISDSVVESARLDGASSLREFWSITLPGIFPAITTFLVAGVAGFFTNQANLYNFYGGGARDDMLTLGYVFFRKIAGTDATNFSQYPYAAAAGLLFTLIAAPITLVAKWALEKFGPSVD